VEDEEEDEEDSWEEADMTTPVLISPSLGSGCITTNV
jgi:hypothetical protein